MQNNANVLYNFMIVNNIALYVADSTKAVLMFRTKRCTMTRQRFMLILLTMYLFEPKYLFQLVYANTNR